jgi:hypothetical protein
MGLDILREYNCVVDVNKYELPEVFPKDLLYTMLKKGRGIREAHRANCELLLTTVRRYERGLLPVLRLYLLFEKRTLSCLKRKTPHCHSSPLRCHLAWVRDRHLGTVLC